MYFTDLSWTIFKCKKIKQQPQSEWNCNLSVCSSGLQLGCQSSSVGGTPSHMNEACLSVNQQDLIGRHPCCFLPVVKEVFRYFTLSMSITSTLWKYSIFKYIKCKMQSKTTHSVETCPSLFFLLIMMFSGLILLLH